MYHTLLDYFGAAENGRVADVPPLDGSSDSKTADAAAAAAAGAKGGKAPAAAKPAPTKPAGSQK